MNKIELRKEVSKLRSLKQSAFNDIYIWVEISRSAISKIPENKTDFFVPKTTNHLKSKEVARNGHTKLDKIVNEDIYYSTYVYLISIMEDYFSNVMKLLLFYDNRRLKNTSSDIKFVKDISIIEFVDKPKELLITEIIERRINEFLYASPKDQLKYFSDALGISIDRDSWNEWIEYKARRDIIIHNSGIINDVYLNKVGPMSIGKKGDKVVLNDEKFRKVVSYLKSLVGTIDKLIREEYELPNAEQANNYEFQEMLDLVLLALTDSEERAIRLMYGIGIEKLNSYDEIAKTLGLTINELEKIHQKAIEKILTSKRYDELKKCYIYINSEKTVDKDILEFMKHLKTEKENKNNE